MSAVREPAVAGRFYAGTQEALDAAIEGCFLHPLGPGSLPEVAPDGPGRINAIISPHAGYMFSGPAAAHGFAALAADGIPDTVVILGPSHYAAARTGAVSLTDAWRTPLGTVPVDVDLGRKLAESSSLLEADEEAHRFEHSLEVQVPFLQFTYRDRVPKICPICLRSHPMGSSAQLIEDARAVGETIAHTVGARRAVLIASTDFSHQVPHDFAQRQDRLALDAILALDPEGLLRTVSENDISMCGPVPVAVALSFCLARGPHQAQLLRYYTSGDIIGDRTAVVGYASVLVRPSGG
ncbi:MAG: AmmeMemoRadiSam system protein B [Armatimonadota bacterium]|nr:MAG: AmmeMemoRadiSam system protein B [Armatimonadota bacterium]